MKIAYPLSYGAEQCYSWNHWVAGEYDSLGLHLEPHPNSASNFSCTDDGVFNFTQWTDDACGENGAHNTKEKHAYRDRCVLDTGMLGTYPVIYSKILTGCGKEPPRRRENAECDEDTPRICDLPYSVTVFFLERFGGQRSEAAAVAGRHPASSTNDLHMGRSERMRRLVARCRG